MLQTLLDRLLGRSPHPAGTQPQNVAPAGPAGAAEAAPTPRRPAPPTAAAVGARRPLVAAQGSIAGFEFGLGAGTIRRLSGRADATAVAVHVSHLLAAMRLCAQHGQIAYAALPDAWCGRAAAPDAMLPRMHLSLTESAEPPDAAALAEAIGRWRACGARIGWPMGSQARLAALTPPDFLVLQAGPAAPADALTALGAARRAAAGVPLLALDLPDIEVLEAALGLGAVLAACRVDGFREPLQARAIAPQARRLLALMSELARDGETAAVVAAIKSDVALSYRLLRQLNSAAVAPEVELGSIEQAVALLGRNELYRWVCVLLTRHAPQRPATQALQAMALARARHFELLAERCGEPHPGALFTMGLATMLPLLLQTSLDDALASLQLHPQAMHALLERAGPWAAYLTLAEVLQEGDLAEAQELAEPFGGLDAVMSDAARAWLFATAAQGNAAE